MRRADADDAAEGPLGTAPVEDGDLELGAGEPGRAAVGGAGGDRADRGQRPDADLERVGQAHAGVEVLAQVAGDGLGLAAHDDEVGLVDDRAVEGEPVELVVLRAVADLGDAELDLEGLRLLGEDLAEGLGVGVGDDPAGDVAAVVGVAADVGQADAGDPQALELAVAADGGEADAVVELADLVQGGAGVLGDEQDAVGVGEDGDAAAAGDALAGVLRAVAHELLGRGVVRHGHGSGLPRHVLAVGGGPLGDDRVGDGGDLGVGEPDGALGVDPVDDRVEPADRVGAAGGGVVVGGVVERLDDGAGGGVGRAGRCARSSSASSWRTASRSRRRRSRAPRSSRR